MAIATPPARPVLGRYRLTERIGMGGTAEVWRATDLTSGREVAVKLLHAHLLPDRASKARLAAEARAVGGLHHPGIVQVLDVDAGEQPAIVLELVDGESLSARLQRDGPLTPTGTAKLGAELADALYHAHTRGVIHRDVKPGNVLLDRDGHAWLVDFGIARLLGEALERTTQPGSVMGTLRYMAPEQLRGDEVGPRTDLYGLGAVLHEALTGRPPHGAATPAGLLEAQRTGPRDLDGVDRGLEAVIVACLAVSPRDRPLHAGRVAAALRAWLDGDPVPALALAKRPAPQPDRDAPTQAIPVVVPPSVPKPSRRPGRRLVALASAAVGVLLIAALAMAAFSLRPAPAAAGNSATPTPAATPLPAWAVTLADRYRSACGTGPTAAQLAALGYPAAVQEVDAAVARCTAPAGGHKGHGKGRD
ncbi:MAG TPA: protein kinase [Candidatus Limnocylindria bacterium]|nr:protein kinase [Candidatus Limnocylindria bacterium]